jgi:hypothetical protein
MCVFGNRRWFRSRPLHQGTFGILTCPEGILVSLIGPRIRALFVKDGRSLAESDRGRPTSTLERNFAVYYDLPAQGTLTLSGGRQIPPKTLVLRSPTGYRAGRLSVSSGAFTSDDEDTFA